MEWQIITNKVLDVISKGEWGHDLIAPQFKRKLKQELSSSDDSLLSLSAQRYLDLNIKFNPQPDPESLSFFHMGQGMREDAVLGLSRSISPEALLAEFTSEDRMLINKALSLIQRTWLEAYTSTISTFELLILLDKVSFRSGSTARAYGAVFLGMPFRAFSEGEAATALVHELAHHELFLVNLLDRLVVESQDNRLEYAPLQGVQRPPIGRLHSLYALFRMLEFKVRTNSFDPLLKQKFDQTYLSLRGDLTPFGLALVEICKERVDEII